ITVGGTPIKAVVQLTKQALVFVFDRTSGRPVWPIEERPVPQSDTPGERTAPTQPFPTKPPAFDRQGVSVDDLIDFTPELRAEAVALLKHYRIGPLFTPPTVRGEGPDGIRGTIQLPGSVGGAARHQDAAVCRRGQQCDGRARRATAARDEPGPRARCRREEVPRVRQNERGDAIGSRAAAGDDRRADDLPVRRQTVRDRGG